jgi:integrase
MSELRKALEEYLAVRRALGFQLSREAITLKEFVRFAERENASFITTDLALRWATQPQDAHSTWWAKRLGMVRRFAQYRVALDPRTEVPSQQLLPHRFRRKQPYIYSDEEILWLIEAAKKLRSPMGLRASTYSTLFGLLTVTGMRISEVIALDRRDVDLNEGILTVRRTKFGKTRLVPLHSSTRNTLCKYARLRDRIYPHPQTPSFLLSDRGTRLTQCTVRWTFVRLSRQIGLRGPADRRGPRLHDFRHGFAIRTLLAWYRAEEDVQRRLPQLSTYLGHRHVADTYWYISAVPELLHLAAQRLERTKGDVTP